MDRQCPSCGGFCKKSGCERENKPMPGSYIYTNNPPVEIKGLMTLRDYFAAKAMQGDISAGVDVHPDEFPALASRAYKIADAMLKARMEKNT